MSPDSGALRGLLLLVLMLAGPAAMAFQGPESHAHEKALPTTGTVEVFFTPGQDAAGAVMDAIRQARKQILVQAFSFTHQGIAAALIAAHRRGVEVRLIADREQTERMERGKVPMLADAGIPVWLDGAHQSAHNKVMLIDSGTPEEVLVTGSYNFTQAAQNSNAENLLLLRGNDKLTRLYRDNWEAHLAHSRPWHADRNRE